MKRPWPFSLSRPHASTELSWRLAAAFSPGRLVGGAIGLLACLHAHRLLARLAIIEAHFRSCGIPEALVWPVIACAAGTGLSAILGFRRLHSSLACLVVVAAIRSAIPDAVLHPPGIPPIVASLGDLRSVFR